LFPTAVTHTVIDEVKDAPGYWSGWGPSSFYHGHLWQRRFHVRTQPSNVAQYHTFLSVSEVGPASTIVALEDAGKVQGVHIDPVNGNDVVVVHNSQQGANIDPTYRDPDHPAQVDAQRFRETGFTFTWTPGSGTTEWIQNDLNPANTWTYTIDGGSSQPITEDANGHWSATLTATSGVAHTIVVTGS
jgi:hypothetical protein